MSTEAGTTKTFQSPVLEVLQALLSEQRNAEVLALVAKLVQRNGELETRLAELLSRRKPREGVSSAQLLLLLDELMGPSDEEREQADAELRDKSGIDDKKDSDAAKAPRGPRQPRLRRPIPPGLRRVPNPITVPAAERACPECGDERACIGHEVTEVVDLIPAEVIVRLDSREKLACRRCDGELVRAPLGDKVVDGGKLGSRLVAELFIDKYDDGLPLHRQKQRWRGYTVADAASVFDASFARDDLIECGCNMHARRYFVKALDRGDKRAALPIAAFKKLYEIEAESAQLDDDARLSQRQARSRPVYEELVSWCKLHKPHEPPQSPLGRAIRYLLNHREALMRFLDDGCIPIDNGVVERLHVRAALTRKNFLFAGSDAGGERAAVAYTILGCCRLARVNPREYLADILPRLARGIRLRDVPDMLPARWKALREQAAAAAENAA